MAILQFFGSYPDAVPPMPADKSALGTLPLHAYQHCEAIRQASGTGWYVFPPSSITLTFDGVAIYVEDEEGGRRASLTHRFLEGFDAHWERIAPADLARDRIPWIEAISTPGVLQIWSSYFVSTAPGWQIHVRPLPNLFPGHAYGVYEGYVRTDVFSPAPLFINLKILSTETSIRIDRFTPLFHVSAAPSDIHARQTSDVVQIEELGEGFDWEGFRRTSRRRGERSGRGSYGAQIRSQNHRWSPDPEAEGGS